MWHAYRRKWAIERKHLPLKDVAAAGGWKDVNTLLEIYQQADEESVLAVTRLTRKLRARSRVETRPKLGRRYGKAKRHSAKSLWRRSL